MEAPLRIWVSPDDMGPREPVDWSRPFAELGPIGCEGETEYIRADLVPQWQPIETAPKSEYVLLWGGGSVLFGIYGWEEDDGPVFYHDGPGYRGCTHWMPLPEPPCD